MQDGGVGRQTSVLLPSLDVDVAQLWADSGCQAFCDPRVTVPTRLVTSVAGLVARLDSQGAALGDRFGAGGLGVLTDRAMALMFRPAGRMSCGGGTRLLRAADGWIAVTLARRDDRLLLPAWLGMDPDESCVLTNSDPWAQVARRVRRRTADDLVESGSLLGLACAAVGEVDPCDAVILESLGDASSRPLDGVRVANLASLWAGPLAAYVLARLGADVVTIESTTRPDGARGTPHWFDSMHAGQRSVALDFRRAEDIETLATLLGAADVVIEGSRPRALAHLGIDARQLVARGPRVWASITAYGRIQRSGMRVGFGDDTAAAGGLIGRLPHGPVFLVDAVADPLTGLVAASTIVDLLAEGGRWLADIALARVAAAIAARPDDPHTAPTTPTAPARRHVERTSRFELGAHTNEVIRQWLSP